MSVIYISLLSGCPCSRVVSKPDEYTCVGNKLSRRMESQIPCQAFQWVLKFLVGRLLVMHGAAGKCKDDV